MEMGWGPGPRCPAGVWAGGGGGARAAGGGGRGGALGSGQHALGAGCWALGRQNEELFFSWIGVEFWFVVRKIF